MAAEKSFCCCLFCPVFGTGQWFPPHPGYSDCCWTIFRCLQALHQKSGCPKTALPAFPHICKNIVFAAVIVTLPFRGHYDNIKHNSKMMVGRWGLQTVFLKQGCIIISWQRMKRRTVKCLFLRPMINHSLYKMDIWTWNWFKFNGKKEVGVKEIHIGDRVLIEAVVWFQNAANNIMWGENIWGILSVNGTKQRKM